VTEESPNVICVAKHRVKMEKWRSSRLHAANAKEAQNLVTAVEIIVHFVHHDITDSDPSSKYNPQLLACRWSIMIEEKIQKHYTKGALRSVVRKLRDI